MRIVARWLWQGMLSMVAAGAALGDTSVAGPAPAPPAATARVHIRNEKDAPYLERWKATASRQAQAFPDVFLVEGRATRAQTGTPSVALTFDDGPDAVDTPAVLDVLRSQGVKATFFVVGERALQHPEVVRRMVAEGHAVAGHAFRHVDLRPIAAPLAWAEHIARTDAALTSILGPSAAANPVVQGPYFRPPYGYVTDEEVRLVAEHGGHVVDWTIDSYDWREGWNAPKAIVERVGRLAYDGGVVLLHSAGPGARRTVAALPALIATLRGRQYRFATVPELVLPPPAAPGSSPVTPVMASPVSAAVASPGIVQAGDPVLRSPARPVPSEMLGTPELKRLVSDMVNAMRRAPGVGLAAPQLGVPLRVFVLEDTDERMARLTPAERTERQREPLPLRVFVNPVVRPVGDETATFFEGCLSVAGQTALVERALEVEVLGVDVDGAPQSLRVRGWPARILQHEMDHLDGTLYVDRMRPRSFMSLDQHKARYAGKPIAEVKALLGEP